MKDLDIKKIQPTKGYVLVEPAKAEEKTKSGIILSESDSEKPQYGVVLAVGEAECDCDCEDGCCDDDCCESESCCCGGHGECQCGEEDEKEEKKIGKDKSKKEESCCSEGESCCGEGCCEEESCCGEGEGCCSDEDSFYISACSCSAPVKVGDKVIYKKWGGNEFKVGDIEYQFLKFEDILAVIND